MRVQRLYFPSLGRIIGVMSDVTVLPGVRGLDCTPEVADGFLLRWRSTSFSLSGVLCSTVFGFSVENSQG